MGRIYTELKCGCLVSCDGGGGLIPCNYHQDNPADDELKEYLDKHEMVGGYCKICHPEQYKKAKAETE